MDFKQVIRTCLDFATANDGTIQSYPLAGCKTNQLDIAPRKSRANIHIEQRQNGDWQAQHTSNATGERQLDTMEEVVSTEKHLLDYLSRYWVAVVEVH
jgi:hypothetical protein